MIAVSAKGTQKIHRVAIDSFKKFTGVSMENAVSKIKGDDDEIFKTLQKWITWKPFSFFSFCWVSLTQFYRPCLG